MEPDIQGHKFWIIGETRRQKICVFMAALFFFLSIVWMWVNGLSYGRGEGEGPGPNRWYSAGFFDLPILLTVLYACFGLSVGFTIMFAVFRFFDRKRATKNEFSGTTKKDL